MVIGLIACYSKKLNNKSLTKDIYISTLFKYSMKYLNKRCDKIFVLSAKHGLLELNIEIFPYDETLNKISKEERVSWGEKVLNELKIKTNIQRDDYISRQKVPRRNY